MYRPLALFLGLRYSQARRSSGFVSFISASSVIGITLGVMALILGLSAMNGFERELHNRVLSVVPHAETTLVRGEMADWQSARQLLESSTGITAAAPLIVLNGLLENGSRMKAVQLRAVLPEAEGHVSAAGRFMSGQGLLALKPGEDGMVLGKGIADKLGAQVGDTLTLMLPDVTASGEDAGLKSPQQRRFRIVSLLEIGGQLDSLLGFIHLNDAQQALNLGDRVQGFSLKTTDLMHAETLAFAAASRLDAPMYVRSWKNSQGYLYQDIQLVRTVMYVVMLMVVAVACFNIVSTLVMAVNEKRSDIAILKTMGAGAWQIRLTFMIQGLVNGLAGSVLGGVLGAGLSRYLTAAIHAIEGWLGHRFLNPDIYFIDFLPSELHGSDVIIVCGSALLMSLLATLYPAWRASGLQPARELGHG
ncbi:lipoprotein-releasing ABC transporter permease subunit LolE [Pseudaeromonas sharmana]|uniref:Lipoprotein-releasing ABC transporter permease subunit LolE n=1 Tax=Pseudaeromonas sharmana TaxID=328412 RepID=A0ABV8CK27_9GAMM